MQRTLRLPNGYLLLNNKEQVRNRKDQDVYSLGHFRAYISTFLEIIHHLFALVKYVRPIWRPRAWEMGLGE